MWQVHHIIFNYFGVLLTHKITARDNFIMGGDFTIYRFKAVLNNDQQEVKFYE